MKTTKLLSDLHRFQRTLYGQIQTKIIRNIHVHIDKLILPSIFTFKFDSYFFDKDR